MHESELEEAEREYVAARAGRGRRRAATSGPSRPALRPRTLDEVIGQERVREQLVAGARGGPRARAHLRPRAALRATRARQDHARDDHRRRDADAAAAHQRSGDHPRRRPGGDPLRPQRGRRAVRRRDPPDVAAGRGDALHGDGGLPGRRRHRQGPRRHRDPAGDPAVHAGRRHHPRGPAARARCATGSASPRTWSSTSPHELDRIVHRSAGLLDVPVRRPRAPPRSPPAPGARPRIANRLLRRVRDFAQVRADGVVTRDIARRALELYEVDESGLDRLDRAVLDVLCRRFGGGPVGVSTLAVAVGEERETVEEVAEPFLVRSGLLARTPRGRVATPAAWRHLGLAVPAAAPFGGRRHPVRRERGRDRGRCGRMTPKGPLHLPVGPDRVSWSRPVSR